MNTNYDVLIIGAGASGSALAYTLCRYTNISRIVIVEKYNDPGQVNTKATNNSQTLHVGDIETNYSIDKVKQVFPAAMMTVHYLNSLSKRDRQAIMEVMPKMVLGVGDEEVALLLKRYEELKPIFPHLQKLDGNALYDVEPAIMHGRNKHEQVLALYNQRGYAVNFELLAQSFITEAKRCNSSLDLRFGSKVETIRDTGNGYAVLLENGEVLHAKTVVVNADSYSLKFAKELGYGKEYALIPIAGTFYFTPKVLNGKVYTVQKPELPFAAVHGDPDMQNPMLTRWGPTARFHPVLESHNMKTMIDYLLSSGFEKFQTWVSFAKILLDKVRRSYLFKNMLYELPYVGKRLFLSNIRKIVPSISASDVRVAKGYGGMRLQRVDTNKHELQLGEGKIEGDNIIFNMTPSPGASVALYNAYRDAEKIVTFLKRKTFFKEEMEQDLLMETLEKDASVSIDGSYVS